MLRMRLLEEHPDLHYTHTYITITSGMLGMWLTYILLLLQACWGCGCRKTISIPMTTSTEFPQIVLSTKTAEVPDLSTNEPRRRANKPWHIAMNACVTTHCSTLQRAAALQNTATHCNTLQHIHEPRHSANEPWHISMRASVASHARDNAL